LNPRILHQRLDDLAECRADNDADRHVEHIALHDELFELLNHDDPSLNENSWKISTAIRYV